MSTAGSTILWATVHPLVGTQSWVVRAIAFSIIPIVIILRVQRGRSWPHSRYTPPPPPDDPVTEQDVAAMAHAGLADGSGNAPRLPPLPAPPPLTYSAGAPPVAGAVPSIPRPPAPVPGLPQFDAPAPPAVVPGVVPEAPGWSPPGPGPGPAVPAPAGLPASGTFSSTALRAQYGVSLFVTAAFLGLLGGGPAIINSFGSRAFIAGGWVFDVAALAALVLGVRGVRVGLTFDAEGVVAHSIFLTRRWSWARLGEFQIQTARMNAPIRLGTSRLRKMLRVVEQDGSFTVLRAMVAPRGGPSDSSWLDDAAAALNAQILARLSV